MTSSSYQHANAIVSTEWLQANLDNPRVRIFDCTTHLVTSTVEGQPYDVVSGRADYDKAHIPGSGFLDLQASLSDNDSAFRFTMLPSQQLAEAFGYHGIGDGLRVILYSRANMQWATRAWWMLRAVGFDDAAILDGGWDKWSQEGRPASEAPGVYPPATLSTRPRPGLFVGKEAVASAIGDPDICTINALSSDLHSGANPRYGRPGRIPGSVNVPAAALLDPTTRVLPPPEVAARAFETVGTTKSQQQIVYCGGGIAATLDAFILHQLGYTDIAVYDNSMSEWANDTALPIETDQDFGTSE